MQYSKRSAVSVVSALALSVWSQIGAAQPDDGPAAQLPPLTSVRLLESPFTAAVKANRTYLLAHDPDRLLAPFLREAGIEPKKPPYPNWESQGLDGHTAGHYLSALADMIASGNDADGELSRRLDYMLTEMDRVQKANGDGYIGGIPKSREFWSVIAAGDVAKIGDRWAPWYNVHKTFAGLRDACVAGGKPKARDLLVKLGDWCVNLTAKLNDELMQRMLGNEFGGMNEVMADLYTITGDKKYLECAKRFDHRAITGPLMRGEDQLTGKHANTQIPKITGMAEIATLTGNQKEDAGARFFWDTVVNHRSVAFGGNSVSEHFNDPKDFSGVIEHREGPETCNTYNMLRLTEKLFASKPEASYADYYERALYNHILSAIDPVDPGYVYFTPLRPEHYRVYSTAEKCFWCCVGTGMENPGRYGQFIYAQDKDGIYVNLFIPSVLNISKGISIEQDNKFPAEPRTRLTLKLDQPSTFSLRIRHPWWVPEGQMSIRVNGQPVAGDSMPSTYATVRRPWQNGDMIEVELPMQISVDPLPDGPNWAAILYGPILLAAPAGKENMVGERAGDGRMAHVATGPMVPLDEVPVLLTTVTDLPKHIAPDPQAGPLHFRIHGVVEPKTKDGMQLVPFFGLHHSRYQMYWNITTAEAAAKRREKLADDERSKAALEAATLDSVRPGEQQSEVEHDFKGEKTETGIHNGRRWRHGQSIQYTLDPRGAKAADLSVTYSGDDRGRTFDIFANDQRIATQELTAESQGRFIEKRYPLPAAALTAATAGRVTIKFVAKTWLAGGVYDVRLITEGASAQPKPAHWKYAPTPPMGWNSWDIFGTTVTEEQAMAQADAMAKRLKPAGWSYFTVDIQWYAAGSTGHVYKEGAPLTMDEHSRLMPALDKFPSAANGVGFKTLGDYVHSKGLKFGIHIMRGIARQAVKQNTPILGTNVRAADIANGKSSCSWNPDMFGVDMSKPGAQEYYDSLFQLYASWGVDFVKCDDISRPYDDGQQAEIEALRKAIDKCGRPMVLSLSPGDTPIERGEHVMQYANMWRISDDFWDRWEPLHGMFGRLEKWTKYRAPGAWPDADMLPFGIVEFKRPTRFTKDEQILCMSLWSIARSPLIFGGDMTKLDDFTVKLLTNSEVLAVNQASDNNRQISRKDDLIVWAADVPDSRDRYVALFNAQGDDAPFDFGPTRKVKPERSKVSVSFADIGITGRAAVRDLWKKQDLGVSDGEFSQDLSLHGSGLYRISPTP